MKIAAALPSNLLNASKFVLNLGATEKSVITSQAQGRVLINALDRLPLLARLAYLIEGSNRRIREVRVRSCPADLRELLVLHRRLR